MSVVRCHHKKTNIQITTAVYRATRTILDLNLKGFLSSRLIIYSYAVNATIRSKYAVRSRPVEGSYFSNWKLLNMRFIYPKESCKVAERKKIQRESYN